jgi:hypothetical protein
VKLIGKERTYIFHWTKSLDKHIKQLIAPKFQDRHKVLCYDYKKEKSLEEAKDCYAVIHSWWYSFGAIVEGVIHELKNWLNFWHF